MAISLYPERPVFHAVDAWNYRSIVVLRKLYRYAREIYVDFVEKELMPYQQKRGKLIRDDLNCPLIEFRRAVQFSRQPCLHPLRLRELEVIEGRVSDQILTFIYASKRQVRTMLHRRYITSADEDPVLATNIRPDSYKLSFEDVVRAHCCARHKQHGKVSHFVAIFISNRFRRIGDQVLTDKDGERAAYQFWWRRGGESVPYDILMSGKALFSGGGERRLPNSKYNCPPGEEPSAYCKRLRMEYKRQFSRS